jgi:hypothetical protein
MVLTSWQPVLTVRISYNTEAQPFTMKGWQKVPATLGQPEREPMLIPLAASS